MTTPSDPAHIPLPMYRAVKKPGIGAHGHTFQTEDAHSMAIFFLGKNIDDWDVSVAVRIPIVLKSRDVDKIEQELSDIIPCQKKTKKKKKTVLT